jgi:hypothetical protein
MLATIGAHGIADADHDDRDARRCLLGCARRRRAEGRDHVDGAASEFSRDVCEPVRNAIAIAVLVGDGLAFDVA